MIIREKKHRLPQIAYEGFVIVSFTICVKNRYPLFNERETTSVFADILLTEAGRFESLVIIYLFMPDHLHLVLQGNSDTARPLKAVNGFKQKTGYWLSKHRVNAAWQKGFYDRILRDESNLVTCVDYILNNPVRAGLVENALDFPFKHLSKAGLMCFDQRQSAD
jgi:putative transposase